MISEGSDIRSYWYHRLFSTISEVLSYDKYLWNQKLLISWLNSYNMYMISLVISYKNSTRNAFSHCVYNIICDVIFTKEIIYDIICDIIHFKEYHIAHERLKTPSYMISCMIIMISWLFVWYHTWWVCFIVASVNGAMLCEGEGSNGSTRQVLGDRLQNNIYVWKTSLHIELWSLCLIHTKLFLPKLHKKLTAGSQELLHFGHRPPKQL